MRLRETSLRIAVLAVVAAPGCGLARDATAPAASSTGPAATTTGSTVTEPPPTATSVGGTSTAGSSETGVEIPTDGAFLVNPDGGSISIQCSLWDQDCPPGEKCAPWANDGGSAWNATRCVPVVEDPDAPGEPCTVMGGSGVSGEDTCQVGAMCWDVDPDTGYGTCVAQCSGSENAPTCDDPLTRCSINGEGVITLCFPTCDPLAAEPCPEGEGCYPIDNRTYCASAPDPEGAGLLEPCEYINACAAGLACTNQEILNDCPVDAYACCTRYCDLSSPDCPAYLDCTRLYEEGNTPAGAEHVGLCTNER